MGQCQLRSGEGGTWRFAGLMGQRQLRSGESGTRTQGAAEDGSVSRSIPFLALRWRPGRGCGPGRQTPQVGAGDHPGQDAQPTPHRLSLLGGAGRRPPLRRLPAVGRWSPRQLVHLPAVCRDSSERGPRRRVCTIATRNKTSHRSAKGCGVPKALFSSAPSTQYRGCTGV